MDDRTQIAAMAMQAILTNQGWLDAVYQKVGTDKQEEAIAAIARHYADALIAELERTKPKCEHDGDPGTFRCRKCNKELPWPG